MKFKKVLATMMAMSMVMGTGLMAHAAQSPTVPAKYNTEVRVSTSALVIDVTVPTTITPTNPEPGKPATGEIDIINNSKGKVHIVDAIVTDVNGWNLVNFDDGVDGDAVDSKNYILSVNGDKAVPNNSYGGDIDCTDWGVLEATNNGTTDTLKVAYESNISPQATKLTDAHIGTITLIVDWYTVEDDKQPL